MIMMDSKLKHKLSGNKKKVYVAIIVNMNYVKF